MRVEMGALKVQYANPLFRLPMTVAEIFPVGVRVSLVSAALRNSRFLAACLTPDSGVRSVDIDLAFPPRLPAHPGLTLAEV
jgi:hypothetical protein